MSKVENHRGRVQMPSSGLNTGIGTHAYSTTYINPERASRTHSWMSSQGLSILSVSLGPGTGQEVQTENVTVAEGGVAEITCRLHQYDGSIVVIQNPARQTLFFNGTRGECRKPAHL